MSLLSRALSPLNAVITSFALLTLIASGLDAKTSSEEHSRMAERRRHHTHRHVQHGSQRPSTRPSSETFALNCPHVADANNEQVRIEVTWTKDDTIWLKIENGERRIYNKLSSFDKKRIGNKAVLRVTLNKGRYLFGYDELTGDFGMEIRPVVVSEDEGVWQCHVTVHQKGDTYTLTSRSRVRNLHRHFQQKDDQRHDSPYEQNPMYLDESAAHSKDSFKAFTRHEQSTIEINRDATDIQHSVVFDRSNVPPPVRSGSSTGRHMTIVDYEDGANPDYSISARNYRKRHRHSPSRAFATHHPHSFVYLVTTMLLLIR